MHRMTRKLRGLSASPKPHPSKPHPCNMPQAKTEVALQCSECCAAETALQHRLFCSAEAIWTRSCAAANEKLHCNIEKAALQESGAFLPLSCGFQAPTFRHPRLGPAEFGMLARNRPGIRPELGICSEFTPKTAQTSHARNSPHNTSLVLHPRKTVISLPSTGPTTKFWYFPGASPCFYVCNVF